jgi:urease accessory protein
MNPATRFPFAASLLAGLLAAGPALAHHPMGGTTPATLGSGLLSGLGHPVIGLDHLAALVAVGLLAARFAGGAWLPLAWLAAMTAGVAVHLGRIDLPYGEVLVALSVVTLGAVAALRPTLPAGLVAGLFAGAGFVHGFALAESIVGAETTPLAAYLVGLVAIQSLIAAGAYLGARSLLRIESAPARLRYAGIAVALVGAGALVLALPGLA